MSNYLLVEPADTSELGLSEDYCGDLIDLDWDKWVFKKISFWHPAILISPSWRTKYLAAAGRA